jgi:hypothetical protein
MRAVHSEVSVDSVEDQLPLRVLVAAMARAMSRAMLSDTVRNVSIRVLSAETFVSSADRQAPTVRRNNSGTVLRIDIVIMGVQ